MPFYYTTIYGSNNDLFFDIIINILNLYTKEEMCFMAGTKIFVSSTCYDLSILRAELRNFILSLGHEPVMSEYADVLYDPRSHTHTSCINEVQNCDVLVVIIGSRFGGTSVPEAIEQIDIEKIKDLSDDTEYLSGQKKISITQLEVLCAIEKNIPVYTFVEKKVYYEHEVYEKNKNKPEVIENMVFPAIDKPETAKYIFDFMNFIRKRATGNSYFQFERLQDITETLKKQWSAYFQRLLCEQRNREEDIKQFENLNVQFQELKTAMITSIQDDGQREVANGIVRYKRLAEFLFGIKCELNFICNYEKTFDELLHEKNIIEMFPFEQAVSIDRNRDKRIFPRTILLLEDRTFYDSKLSIDFILNLREEWELFKQLSKKSKMHILEALKEIGRPVMLIRYFSEPFEEYCDKINWRNFHSSHFEDE